MNKISIIAAPDLRADGSLYIKDHHTIMALAGELADKYEVTLILKGKEAYSALPNQCTAVYDASKPQCACGEYPTYTQKNFFSWKSSDMITKDEADILLCMDAYYPWALAACKRARAKKNLLWVNDIPEKFLLENDFPLFNEIYGAFSRIVFSDEKQKKSFEKYFPDLGNIGPVVPYPVDAEYYQELAAADCEVRLNEDELNIVVKAAFDTENSVMLIPALAREFKRNSEKVHFYIFGSGKYRNHILRDMVLNDVCEAVTLADDRELYPVMLNCDFVMLLPDADNRVLLRAARAYGKNLITPEIIGGSLAVSAWGETNSNTQKSFSVLDLFD